MTQSIHKTVSYGRKSIAFGLSWFATDEDEQPRKAAAALIRQSPLPYDTILTRKGEIQQFALGCSTDGVKNGSISAAAMVAEMAGMDSWLYVLEIGDDFWICAGRDGYVLPDGDRVYESVDSAKTAYADMSPTSFKKVFLPSSWQDDKGAGIDAEGTDIRDFLSYDIPKWAKIQSAASSTTLLKAGAGIALLGGSAFAAFTLLSEPAPPPVDTNYEDALREIAEMEKLEREADYARLDANQPWAVLPQPSDVLRSCIDGIQGLPLTPVGYKIQSVFCAPGHVEANLERTSGYTSWLKEWAAGYPDLSASTDPTGGSGTISKDLPGLEPRGDGVMAMDHTFEKIQSHLFELGQIEGAGVTVGQPTVDVYPDYPDYVPAFATGTYKIITKRPSVWFEFFDKWDGLAVTSVSFNLLEQTYTMEGKLYVPNF